MDPDKVTAVADGSTPSNHKEVQRFLLGWWTFIGSLFKIALLLLPLLHALTSCKSQFSRSSQAESAFQKLKHPLCTLWWKLTLQIRKLTPSYHQGSERQQVKSLGFSFQKTVLQRGPMMSGIVSCWLLRQHWRNGYIGFKGWSNHFVFGLILRI